MAKVGTLLINEPAANQPATVDAIMGGGAGYLCGASGSVTGDQIVEVRALCEALATYESEPTIDADDATNNGIAVDWDSTDNTWTAQYIPGAACPTGEEEQWNVLRVFTYALDENYQVSSTFEQVKFKGVCGSCSGGPGGGGSALAQALLAQLAPNLSDPTVEPTTQPNIDGLFQRIVDLVNLHWTREFDPNPFLHEPTRRDGDWLLYSDLPVDQPVGAILALDGRPLQAAAASVAVVRYQLEQLKKAPFTRVASPIGTGQVSNSIPPWRFPGFPGYSVVMYQPETPQQKMEQLLASSSREHPTRVLLSKLPIRVMPNAPKFLSQLNTGSIDVWIRPESVTNCS